MTAPIRLAHISDSHLGYRALNKVDPGSGRNQRTVDVELAFTRVLDDVLARNVDGIIHSGDVFHHSRPTWQSLRHFIRQMRRIEQAGIPALVISGNHDTPRIRTGGSAYSVLELALSDIRFAAEYADVHDSQTFAGLNLHVQAIPHGALTNPDPVVARHEPGQRNVMVVHGTVPGILPPGAATEPGEQEIDQHLLDPSFDYIALGHIHQHQKVTDNAWYGGAMERCGWGDVTVAPGYNLVELGAPGDPVLVEHITIEARPMIALKPVYADGKSARDVADAVLVQLTALAEPTAMTRVELRKAPRPLRREVQSILRRELGDLAWSLDIAPEKSTFVAAMDDATNDEGPLDLHALFHEFVAQRKGLYPSEAFTAMLLERGDQALTDAMLVEEAPTPEDDAVA